MTPSALAAGAVVSVAFFLLSLASAGFALLRLATGRVPAIRDVGIALGLGYSTLAPLVWAERALGGPWFVLPAVVASILFLRRDWRPLVQGASGVDLLLPGLAGLLAFAVTRGDVQVGVGGMAFRLGFDVSDRSYYAMLAQELWRAPLETQLPLFSGLSLAYSFFPSLMGLFLHLYGGLGLVPVFLVHLPVVALMFTAFAVDSLLWNVFEARRATRVVTAILVVLGGDLSWLITVRNVTALERTRHFFAFQSFAAESLYYNTWMLGVPMALVALTLAHSWLRHGDAGRLLLAAWAVGSLWETKVFAVALLVVGAGTAGLILRRPRLLLLTLASACAALPWVALTLLAAGSGGGQAFGIQPFDLVTFSLSLAERPAWVSHLVHAAGEPWSGSIVRAAAGLCLFLVGAFGLRWVGLGRLIRAVRDDDTGFHAFLAATIGLGIVASLVVVSRPTNVDGVQFLLLAESLMWIYAGPALASTFLYGRGWRTVAGVAVLAAACASPVRYLSLKLYPGAIDAPGSADGVYVLLPPPTLEACALLQGHAKGPGRLLLAGGGGLPDFYKGLLADERVAASDDPLVLAPEIAGLRQAAVARIFATENADEALDLMGRLDVRWIWQDDRAALRFQSPRVVTRFASRGITISECLGR